MKLVTIEQAECYKEYVKFCIVIKHISTTYAESIIILTGHTLY
jgi:hypothetical protein